MDELTLQDLREEITRVDEQMAELFAQRMWISEQIAGIKRREGLPVFDAAREEENLKKAGTRSREDIRPYYLAFLQKCMDLSKAYQEKLLEEGK